MTPTGAGKAVVEVLRAEGVRAMFGIPGGHTLAIYDALCDTPDIRHVLVRHEQVAASMAAGYAQLTGEPGICCVTAGPGATNLVSGIAEAYVGALPLVVLAGRGATATAHKGASQEVPQERIFRAITKWAVRVDRADTLVDILRQAFTLARSGKPGPVLVDLPRDVLAQEIPFAAYRPVGRPPRTRAEPDALRAAAEALAGAERPLIVAGGGVIAAGAAAGLRALAETLEAPVVTTLSGRGSLPDDHPLAAGGLGHHRTRLTGRLLAEADVVLGLGCRFEEQETNWKPTYVPDPAACYIQVDIDPAEIGRSVVPRVAVVGDIGFVLADLIELLRAAGLDETPVRAGATERLRRLADERARIEDEAARMAGSAQQPIHPMRVIRAAREVFPRDTTVAFDVGVLAQGMAGAFPYFKVYEPRSTIVPSSFYGMGFASAALPAARLVHPERNAIGFVGDGSFQMIMNVLPMAAENGLPVTWIVLNDHALGSIWHGQGDVYANRHFATTFDVQPDFARIAEACRCHGETVRDPAGVHDALERARAANARGVPAVVDVLVARERVDGSRDFFARR